MKKAFFILLLSAGFFSLGQSQELGIRLGDAAGGNFAFDGVFALGEFNRVHADLAFGNDGASVEALYDFLYRPVNKGWDWYAGVGPFAFLGTPFAFGVAGEIGIEYHADVPMAVGVDYRPSFQLVDKAQFHGGWFGLNLRYVFGKEGGL